MTKPIPQISKYMSTTPHTAGPSSTLDQAMKLMRENQIRHLPILDGNQLVGILSERDIRMIESFKGVDPTKVLVGDTMEQNVYVVPPSASLDQVAAEMASKKYGSAVVMQNLNVVGIFTAVDAMSALSELLQTRLAHT
jgi:acetoin utilization protein AcuB